MLYSERYSEREDEDMLSTKAWTILQVTLFVLALGFVVDNPAVRIGAIVGLALLAVERVVNWHRGRRAVQ
jgi:predicted histidine transporter YuiF (NhaC family)